MDELSPAERTGFPDLTRVGVDALATDDSPLANAIRRRQKELDRPAPVIAGHDSVI